MRHGLVFPFDSMCCGKPIVSIMGKLGLFYYTVNGTAVTLVACATNKGGYSKETAVENQLVKMTKDEVLIDLGPPDKKTIIDENREAWRYQSEVGGLTGGECTLSILFNGEIVREAKLSANDLSWVAFPLGSCTKIIQTLR